MKRENKIKSTVNDLDNTCENHERIGGMNSQVFEDSRETQLVF